MKVIALLMILLTILAIPRRLKILLEPKEKRKKRLDKSFKEMDELDEKVGFELTSILTIIICAVLGTYTVLYFAITASVIGNMFIIVGASVLLLVNLKQIVDVVIGMSDKTIREKEFNKVIGWISFLLSILYVLIFLYYFFN